MGESTKESASQQALITEDLAFASTDTTNTCRGYLWLPEGTQPTAVIQIVHGMAEHIERYEDFAVALAAQGWATAGIDHTGHGRTTPDAAARGVYDPSSGAQVLIDDQAQLTHLIKERYPGVPVVILGHSMGSFITRCYLAQYGREADAAIIMGTGWQPGIVLALAKLLTRLIALFHGWDYRSPFIDKLGVGGYNKAFEGTGAATGYEWLSRDPERARAYAADPDCGFMFSLSGYKALFELVDRAQAKATLRGTTEALPILIISGSDDPVGSMGQAPARLFEELKRAGVEDVEFELIEGGRHEILGETNAAEVAAEIIQWIAEKLS